MMKRRFDRETTTTLPETIQVFHPRENGADSGPGMIASLTRAQIAELAQSVVDDHAKFPDPPFVAGGRYAPGSEMSRILGLDARDAARTK